MPTGNNSQAVRQSGPLSGRARTIDNLLARRSVGTVLKPSATAKSAPAPRAALPVAISPVAGAHRLDTARIDRALAEIEPELMDAMDAEVALKLQRNQLSAQLEPLIAE